MIISKKQYAVLTLPWRIIESLPCVWELEQPRYSFVTECKVFWLRLLFPFAWLLVPFIGGLAVLAFVAIVVTVPILYPIVKLREWIGRRAEQCKRVEWTDEETP